MEILTHWFVSWFPLLLLIAFWVFFMKKGGLGKQSQYMEQMLEKQNTMNEIMERIAVSLEKLASK